MEREREIRPERGDMRGKGGMKCVLLLEELWLPVSISLQATFNKHRGRNPSACMWVHTHTHTHSVHSNSKYFSWC